MLEIIFFVTGSLLFLSVGVYSLYKFYIQKKNPFLVSEASRALNNNFKIHDAWSSQGRIYTRGMSMTKDSNGNINITQQAKLADSGLLF